MPLDIMSGFSGGAAPTGAARTGAPPVIGSEPTVTFASLLTGKATASPKGSVKKSGGGDGDAQKDDSKSDAKTGDASAKLDPSLIAWNIVPATSPPQILLPQIQSEPTVPPNADAKAGTSVAMDASQVLSRLQARGSQTGGELLSTLKQTIAAASVIKADASLIKTGASQLGAPAGAAKPSITAGAVVATDVIAADAPSHDAASQIAGALAGKGASAAADMGLPAANGVAMPSNDGAVSAASESIAPPVRSLFGMSGATPQDSNGAARTSSPTRITLEAHAAFVSPPLSAGSDGKAAAVIGGTEGKAAAIIGGTEGKAAAVIGGTEGKAAAIVEQLAAKVSAAPTAGTSPVFSAPAAVAAGVGANAGTPQLAAPAEKYTLQKVRGGPDNNGVKDVRITAKGAGKELPESLLQSLNAKPVETPNTERPSLGEALMKAEITGGKTSGGDLPEAALLTSETGPAASAVVNQPIAALMPARDRAAMIHQVVEKIGEMRLDAKGTGGDKVTLQLHPKDWGQLNLTVTMTPKIDASGQTITLVTAHVAAENPSVKAALEGHLNDLRRSLHEQGLKLDSLTVTTGSVSAASASAQSNGGGLMSGHPHSDDGGHAPAGQTSAQSGGFNGSGQDQRSFADFAAGQFGGGRREQQDQPAWTAHDADQETAPVAAIRSAAGRVDTRA